MPRDHEPHGPPPADGVAPLDPLDERDVAGVVALYLSQLDTAPAPPIQGHFLRRFRYRRMVHDGEMACTVARRDGRVVGFAAYTTRPRDYAKRAMRRRCLSLVWTLLTGLLTQPRPAANIGWIVRSMLGRDRLSRPDLPASCGEALHLAAHPEHETWVPPGGSARVTVRLFEEMVRYFRERHVEEIFLLVRKTNTASLLFCHSMGCRLEKGRVRDHPDHHFFYSIGSSESVV